MVSKEIENYIKKRKKISSRTLMKKFSIGYSRASYILNQLEAKGLVSKAKPNRARRVLDNL